MRVLKRDLDPIFMLFKSIGEAIGEPSPPTENDLKEYYKWKFDPLVTKEDTAAERIEEKDEFESTGITRHVIHSMLINGPGPSYTFDRKRKHFTQSTASMDWSELATLSEAKDAALIIIIILKKTVAVSEG